MNENTRKLSIIIIFLIAVLGILLVITNTTRTNSNNTEQLSVLVSILPQKEFVQKVAGDDVQITALIKPGESPATYSLTANDLQIIENADIYFRIGHIEFEKANIDRIKNTNPDLKIIGIPDSINLRYFLEDEEHTHEDEEHAHEDDNHEEVHGELNNEVHDETDHTTEKSIDPHIWLSIPNVKTLVESIESELSAISPERAEEFRENTSSYKQELDLLDRSIAENLKESKGKTVLVFHPAWGYFTDQYGLNQVAIESSGNDPTAAQIESIINFAKEQNITAIFVQEQFSTQAAESIAEELGITVIKIDPLAEDYIENLQNIADSIKNNV